MRIIWTPEPGLRDVLVQGDTRTHPGAEAALSLRAHMSAAMVVEVAQYLSEPRTWDLTIAVRGVLRHPGGDEQIDTLRFRWVQRSDGGSDPVAADSTVSITANVRGRPPHDTVTCVVVLAQLTGRDLNRLWEQITFDRSGRGRLAWPAGTPAAAAHLGTGTGLRPAR